MSCIVFNQTKWITRVLFLSLHLYEKSCYREEIKRAPEADLHKLQCILNVKL